MTPTRFLLCALMLLPSMAWAQEQPGPATYVGTVGRQDVVMELEGHGEDGFVSGRYHYRRLGYDIDLSGDGTGTNLALEARETGDRLVLDRRGDGLAGQLTTRDGRRVAVALHPAPTPAGDMRESPYDRLRLERLPLTQGETQVLAGRRIRWLEEPRSAVRLFRIESGYPAEVMAAINAGLEEIQRQQINEVMGCAGAGGAGSGMEGHNTSAPYLSADHVSFRIDAGWYCAGAAHPDFGTQGFTFDARTGAALTLEDMVRVPGQDAPAPRSDTWYQWRGDVLAPRLVALLRRFHPQEMAPPAGPDDECDYSDPQVWNFPAWFVSAQGLHVGATFPRVIRVCDNPDWAVIPLSALDQPRPE